MKKIMFCLLMCLNLVCLVSCSNNSVRYELKDISISIYTTGETTQVKYNLEDFDQKYFGKIDDLGKIITLKNNNELVFTGKLTKNMDGKAELYDIGFWVYVTFEKQDFYNIYKLAEINKDDLFIKTKDEIISNQYINITYRFTKVTN